MRIYDAGEARAFDSWAEGELGVPSLVLMENAAIGTVDAILERYSEARTALVLCGPGRNGGDGWAVARHLVTRGLGVVALPWSAGPGGRQEALDTRTQRGMATACGVETLDPAEGGALADRLVEVDVVVDALLGTGLSRPVEGALAALLEQVGTVTRSGRRQVPIIAVDLPTGLDASTGQVSGPVLRADLTVTFATLKWAHVFPPARDLCGDVVVADLGVPTRNSQESLPSLELLDAEEVAAWVPQRPRAAHKGTFGHLLLIAGGGGTAGAATLSARAALRSGAGRVTVATSLEAAPIVHAGCWEAMTLPLPLEDGWTSQALTGLLQAAEGKQAVGLGPGIGTGESTAAGVREFCARFAGPLVLDADALTAFSGRIDELARRGGNRDPSQRSETVLTPHPGEMARLLGRSVAEVEGDRVASAREAARRSGAVVVLKGHLSVIATPSGSTRISPTGNPGMATAGCGDALTGIVGALLARGYDSPVAAALGTYLHGLAGDLVAGRSGEEGLVASDLIDELPRAWRELSSE